MNYLLTLSLFAVGLLNPASVGTAQTADPIARDIASSAGLLCDGKVSCLTQGEHPVFDYDGDGSTGLITNSCSGTPACSTRWISDAMNVSETRGNPIRM